MPLFRTLPIMPKESKTPVSTYATTSAPYPTPSSAGPRNAAIWSAGDDEILVQARASGLNWQPIASRHFPNKTANACRKRHERLIERRHVEDWDAQKLELLAQEYMTVRKEMWEILATRVGERWAVIEAKVSTYVSLFVTLSDDHAVYGERIQKSAGDSSHCSKKGARWQKRFIR